VSACSGEVVTGSPIRICATQERYSAFPLGRAFNGACAEGHGYFGKDRFESGNRVRCLPGAANGVDAEGRGYFFFPRRTGFGPVTAPASCSAPLAPAATRLAHRETLALHVRSPVVMAGHALIGGSNPLTLTSSPPQPRRRNGACAEGHGYFDPGSRDRIRQSVSAACQVPQTESTLKGAVLLPWKRRMGFGPVTAPASCSAPLAPAATRLAHRETLALRVFHPSSWRDLR